MRKRVMTQIQLYICLVHCNLVLKNKIKHRLRDDVCGSECPGFIWCQNVRARVCFKKVGVENRLKKKTERYSMNSQSILNFHVILILSHYTSTGEVTQKKKKM